MDRTSIQPLEKNRYKHLGIEQQNITNDDGINQKTPLLNVEIMIMLINKWTLPATT